MTGSGWVRAREIFEAAIERSAGDRLRYLDEACGGDELLREEVRTLLEAHDKAGDFIEQPVFQAAAALLVDPEPDALVGRSLGPYMIRREIGRGASGVVYLADDTRLSRRVAVKALIRIPGAEAHRRDRIRHEARAAAALAHPGIATVYALEDIDDELYLVSEYVAGPTLRTLIAQGPLAPALVLDIAIQLARALAAAHAQGVTHGDLKPENVIRTGTGVVKILDFGVARLENEALVSSLGPAAAAGTPGYMAPEQIRGDGVDSRADLFAFGVIVYEMAAGQNPFADATVHATVTRILEVDPPPFGDSSPLELLRLNAVIAKCLRKSPAERYESTEKLLGALVRLERDDGQSEASRSAELSPRWWWGFHQVAISIIYTLTLYPVWRVRAWLPRPWGMLFLFLVLACVAAAVTVRLHLWFTARFYPSELSAQRERAVFWTRWTDVGFCSLLLLAGLQIEALHPEIATLFVAVSIAAAVASFVIEPTTTRAAFRRATARNLNRLP